MNRLVMMRGLPGSGKSNLAHKISEEDTNSVVLGTDDYFVDENGSFRFISSENSKAKDWHYSEFLNALLNEVSLIIIDNPNTKFSSMKDYVERGLEFGYNIEFALPETDWAWDVDELESRNIHGVDCDYIESLKENFEHNATVEKILNSKRV